MTELDAVEMPNVWRNKTEKSQSGLNQFVTPNVFSAPRRFLCMRLNHLGFFFFLLVF